MLVLGLAGCGSSVAHAQIGPIVPAPPTDGAAAPADEVAAEIDAARSHVEVAGADRITGEHIAYIAAPRVTLRKRAGASVLRDLVVEVDLRTLTMDDPGIESFVKSPDFLDVERHPIAIFRSREVAPRAGSTYHLSGVLSLHGVSRQIEFLAHVTRNAEHIIVEANFLLPRKAFAIRRHDALDVLISADFRVHVRVVGRFPESRGVPPSRVVTRPSGNRV